MKVIGEVCARHGFSRGKLLTGGHPAGQTETHCNKSQVCMVKTWKRRGDSLDRSQHTPELHQPMSFRQENDQSVLVHVIHSLRTGTKASAALLVNDTDK